MADDSKRWNLLRQKRLKKRKQRLYQAHLECLKKKKKRLYWGVDGPFM